MLLHLLCAMLLLLRVTRGARMMRLATQLSSNQGLSSPAAPVMVDCSKYLLSQENVVTMKSAYLHGLFVFNTNLVPEPEQSTRYLLSEVMGINSFKYSDFFNTLNDDRQIQLNTQQVERFNSHITSRMNRVPIQYIIGNWDFYGQTYDLAPPILIPRPETEEMVEMILARHKKTIISSVCGGVDSTKGGFSILDIGSGSGVIGISLLKELRDAAEPIQGQQVVDRVLCSAIDINERAVQLSRSNAAKVLGDAGRGYSCRLSSIFHYSSDSSNHNKFDLIVSNPPYIPEAEMEALAPEVARYEDRAALCGGREGLDVINEIIAGSSRLLRGGSPVKELWMECSHNHPLTIKRALESSAGSRHVYKGIEAIDDFNGKNRFVRIVFM